MRKVLSSSSGVAGLGISAGGGPTPSGLPEWAEVYPSVSADAPGRSAAGCPKTKPSTAAGMACTALATPLRNAGGPAPLTLTAPTCRRMGKAAHQEHLSLLPLKKCHSSKSGACWQMRHRSCIRLLSQQRRLDGCPPCRCG